MSVRILLSVIDWRSATCDRTDVWTEMAGVRSVLMIANSKGLAVDIYVEVDGEIVHGEDFMPFGSLSDLRLPSYLDRLMRRLELVGKAERIHS